MGERDKLQFENQEEDELTEIAPERRRVYSDKPDRSIFELYRQYQKGNLELQPEFQRLQVWDNKKASRLIGSVLLEVPIPVIYLSEESDSKYSVIDGQQRLNSFISFLENKIRLSGLNILTELNGKRFQGIPKSLQDKFENATIRIIEIRKESHPDVKFEIFERLNTGAVQLNAQELRNCIYRGRYNELLLELSLDRDFQFLLGLKAPHHRMQDRELILRFFTFYHNTHLKYAPPMKRFLNRDIENYKNLDDAEEKHLKKTFKKTVRLSKTVFGDKAFKRFILGSIKEPNGHWETKKINKALYDIIMFGFTIYEENQIIPNSDLIREELIWLMTYDSEFIDSITFTTDKKEKIHTRFDKWLTSLKQIVGTPVKEPRTFSLQYKRQLWESNSTCAICGQMIHVLDDSEVDHIMHYWRGGSTIPTNARL
ncbi:MAG: HNH endonuclease family protein, partial [bacterium]